MIAPKTNAIVGIDIGGTKIRGIVWNKKRILKSVETPTPKNLAAFKLAIENMISQLGGKTDIAIGAAGIIQGNKIAESPNIPYIKNLDFSFTGAHIGAKRLDNDARCFARAQYGARKQGRGPVLFITIGTGIGRALGKDNNILKIKKFEYPENWEKEYQVIKEANDTQKLAKYLGEKITVLATSYHAKSIVVGGGILGRKHFFKELKKEISIPIQKSIMQKNAGALGAAMLCL